MRLQSSSCGRGLSLSEFNTSSLLLFQKLVYNAFILVVYWKLNILRYLCPLLFPRPKILVVLFRTREWKVKNELQKIVEKLMDLKLQKTETNGNFLSWIFFSSYGNFQTTLSPEGKRKLVRVSGSSSYRGFELPRVKLQWMYDGNPGEIDFGSSYRESTVSEHLFWEILHLT